MMLTFDFFMPTRIVFGPGRLNDLEKTTHLPAGTRAMIVIGATGAMLQEGYLARVQGLLAARGVASLVYDRIRPNPATQQVDDGAQLARTKTVDFIVGLGGGSTIDAAKGMALMARNPGHCWDYVGGGSGGGKTPDQPALPLVAIPTTAGTGTEADSWSVVTRTGHAEKIGWGHPSMFPHLAIVDPDLSLSVPAATTAHTGMEAFFHAVEALLARCRQPTSDLLALEAVQIISRYLPKAVADGRDREARTLMMWASTAAGICASLSSCIALHSLSHALTAHAPDLPHGVALTLLSRPYFKWLGQGHPERFDLLAAAMGQAENTPGTAGPERFDTALKALIGAVGLDQASPAAWGLGADRFADLARTAFETMAGLFEVTPVPMTTTEAEAILADALDR
jgi:alcohol dehydrogenase